MSDIVTADLSSFGYRELREAIELLKAYINSKTTLDVGEGLKLCFNTHSGFVFLSDEDYRVYMINKGELEEWFSCPNCGFEGFKHDMEKLDNHTENDEECKEYIEQLKELE